MADFEGISLSDVGKDYLDTVHGKILVGKIGKNLVNRAKFSLAIFTDIPKMYLAYALAVAYLPNFYH